MLTWIARQGLNLGLDPNLCPTCVQLVFDVSLCCSMKTLALPTDGASLRLYVISLFTVLQALKFYEFVTLRAATDPQLLKFLAKWFVLDILFVSVLPFLNIPWLKFRRSSQVLQIAFVFVLNWGLSYGWDVIRDSGLSVGTIGAGLLKSMSLPFPDISILQQGAGDHRKVCRCSNDITQLLAYSRTKGGSNPPGKVFPRTSSNIVPQKSIPPPDHSVFIPSNTLR